ncbi:MAG: AMP-binding protein [Deltaproteobacteria bacterium]|jgi:acyl-CoA synthetase (AMP-forming)/AMP-acid ligase II|nr:AMP-binding protein [Deltaproteobacteria bacterium]
MPDFDVQEAFSQLRTPGHRPTIPNGPRTVADVLERSLREHPDKEFVVGRGRRLSYAEFDAEATRAASAFASLGVCAGDRVAMSLPTDIDITIGFHGLLRLGAIWLGINRNLAPAEKRYMLQDAGVSLAVGDPEMAEEYVALQAEVPDLREVVVCDRDDPHSRWYELLENATSPPPEVEIDPFQAGGFAYTSGTTGFPKGVVHSHHNLLVPGAAQARMGSDYHEETRRGDCFPLTILNMQVLSTLLVAQAGATCVFMDRIDAQGVAEWIKNERVTLFTAPPALIYSLANDDSILPEDLQTLDRLLFGGGACPAPIIDAFEGKFDVPVRGTYGLTEAPTALTIETPGSRGPVGSSGVPLEHVELTIRDDEDRALPPGEQGEVCVGPMREGSWADVYTPMLGYWRKPEATRETLRGGLLHTGDIGYLDEDRNLFIVDRKNLMILRGGANVYPAEIERVLHEDQRVEACAVVGVEDERLGERVAAWVQVAEGATLDPAELQAHCRQRLAKYKVPEKIELIDEMPRNAMNKIMRRALPEIVLDPV